MFGKTARVLALLGAFGVAALAGCGDGDSADDDLPEMAVTVEVNGVISGALHAGDTLTVQVPSGTEVVVQSNIDSTWAQTAPPDTVTMHRTESRVQSATLSSMTGATAVMTITNAAAASEVVTVVVQIDAATFNAVRGVAGDTFYWQSVDDGGVTSDWRETIVVVDADGSRSELSESLFAGTYNPYLDSYFDSEDRLVKDRPSYAEDGFICTYEPPYAKVSFPLYVGKSWSSDTRFDGCFGDTAAWSRIETRTVQAFERISIPAGEFETLRIHGDAQSTIYDLDEVHSTRSETCWWSVTLGRFIKCEATVTYQERPDWDSTVESVLTKVEH